MNTYEALQAIRERAKLADTAISAVNKDQWGAIHVARVVRSDDTAAMLDALTAVLDLVDSTSVVYIPDLRHVIAKALGV